VVAETTILLNFYAGKLPVAFPIWTAESGHCVARIERPPRANSGLGALFDQLIGVSQQPVWFIDLAVLRLVDSLKRTRCAQSANSVGLGATQFRDNADMVPALDWRL
jgi:hypothetical protein